MTTVNMPFFTIDTLQFSKRIQKAGLQQQIAEELVGVIVESQSKSFENLATRQDVEDLKKDMEDFKTSTRKELESFKTSTHNELESFKTSTHSELESFKISNHKDFVSLETRFDQKLELLKRDVVIKLGSLMSLGVGIIALMIKL